ncbi:sugar ABC transporter ATP-binding protein [Kaistia dalseonensis]|uniref:Ribose transport system ATP-binding protein n=1 Tax=Kaistia dalseonensis TaxID=410840 RepID=A0ABU0H2X1_9HYPH|nr:sugar ABC transporter ATP-binding protein [Kaistia dalseonensis]MCX5494076.1 sugar ABC transporter ATP-binding protein [Kaistia dalseonensis]MDQ0436654.1 ribose transport system ATP-binding protein [Kaistia dalseonensis]
MDLIEATGITKRYGGITALSDANFRASAGEVHALLGENGAGKSTFIQILAGIVRPNGGTLNLNGSTFRPGNAREAQAAGISAVFQELSLVPDLTVAENIWFRREPLSAVGMVRKDRERQATLDLFERYRIPAPSPDREVRRLTLAERQIVEIAKGLSRAPSVLILDEATSALPPRETDWLLGLATQLAEEGMLVIYISHRLAEVRQIAQRITVFRNGATVATHDTSAVDDDTIIADMLGRRMDRLYPERISTATDRVALRLRGLSVGSRLADIDLELKEGEVMGVAGLQGHGQRELFQSLFGISRARGEIELWGKPSTIRSPRDALIGRDGIALVPEDRRSHGLLLTKSVRENLTLSVIPRFTRFGLLSKGRERALVDEMLRTLQIKAGTPDQLAGTLSGGNQQKVIFGKMLLTQSRILLLYDPTRGIDVGTKGEIFRLMRDLAAKGYAILFYSSDLPEIVNVADRVAVLRNGRLAATLSGDEISEHRILREAMFEARAA